MDRTRIFMWECHVCAKKKYVSLTLDMSISDMSFRHIKTTKQRFDNDHSPDWRSRDALQFFSFKSSCLYIENNTQHVVTITVWSR